MIKLARRAFLKLARLTAVTGVLYKLGLVGLDSGLAGGTTPWAIF